MNKILLFCLLLAMLSSCAHVISSENRTSALSSVPLNEIRAHTDQYTEKTFIFGGIIAETRNTEAGSELEVVQMPLDDWGYVVRNSRSSGRFLVIDEAHLDPLIYRKGSEVTIAGVLIGIRTDKLGDKEYDYPLFKAKEIHLLPQRAYYRYPYYGYEPYYYPPYHYPYPGYWGYYPFYVPPLLYFHIP